jgi:UDP-4-amino-4,6-dideoxy-N-acetyl-beta-L-altrosamine transaminase
MAEGDFLPYGRQTIEEDDIAAVAAALRGELLTTGPLVPAFETAFAATVGAEHAVACSSGTAALHLALLALDVRPGEAVIVPAVTFVATANCARYVGAEPVFADVDPESGLMTEQTLRAALARLGGRRLAAVLPVHLTGSVGDLPAIRAIADGLGASVVEDACHALGTWTDFGAGAEHAGDARRSAMATFSFHPVKTIATGEGGMVTTNDAVLARRLALLRSHGITREAAAFQAVDISLQPDGAANPWANEMQALGFNYRLPDVLCALGLSQLAKLARFAARRRTLAARYRGSLAPLAPLVRPAAVPAGCDPAPHLFVVLADFEAAGTSRASVMHALEARGIGTQVHYIPVHRQPYHRERCGDVDLPGADAWYARCLSLPLFPAMADEDVDRVAAALGKALGA